MNERHFSLSLALQSLVNGIVTYESDTFSASESCLNLQKAEMMAAHLIREYLFAEDGEPMGSIDGASIGYAMDAVDAFLCSEEDKEDTTLLHPLSPLYSPL
jgi:hypothetical protein